MGADALRGAGRRREVKVTLQVERHVVAVETDHKPADGAALFRILLAEVVRKMDQILSGEKGGTK